VVSPRSRRFCSLCFEDIHQHQHQHPAQQKLNGSNRAEPTVGRGKCLLPVCSCLCLCLTRSRSIAVADYDPLNDDRGSLARGYEPTSKAMHAASKFRPHKIRHVVLITRTSSIDLEFEVHSKNVPPSSSTCDQNNGNGNGNAHGNPMSYEIEQHFASSRQSDGDHAEHYSHGDMPSAQVDRRRRQLTSDARCLFVMCVDEGARPLLVHSGRIRRDQLR
jgi:hypothetical protein